MRPVLAYAQMELRMLRNIKEEIFSYQIETIEVRTLIASATTIFMLVDSVCNAPFITLGEKELCTAMQEYMDESGILGGGPKEFIRAWRKVRGYLKPFCEALKAREELMDTLLNNAYIFEEELDALYMVELIRKHCFGSWLLAGHVIDRSGIPIKQTMEKVVRKKDIIPTTLQIPNHDIQAHRSSPGKPNQEIELFGDWQARNKPFKNVNSYSAILAEEQSTSKGESPPQAPTSATKLVEVNTVSVQSKDTAALENQIDVPTTVVDAAKSQKDATTMPNANLISKLTLSEESNTSALHRTRNEDTDIVSMIEKGAAAAAELKIKACQADAIEVEILPTICSNSFSDKSNQSAVSPAKSLTFATTSGHPVFASDPASTPTNVSELESKSTVYGTRPASVAVEGSDWTVLHDTDEADDYIDFAEIGNQDDEYVKVGEEYEGIAGVWKSKSGGKQYLRAIGERLF